MGPGIMILMVDSEGPSESESLDSDPLRASRPGGPAAVSVAPRPPNRARGRGTVTQRLAVTGITP